MHSLLVALILSTSPVAESTDVYDLSEAAFVETARRDLLTLHQFVGGMDDVVARVKSNSKLFSTKAKSVYSPEEKQTLLSTWGSLFAYFSATEGLRQKYWNFIKHSPTSAQHHWGYLITHTALTALLANGLSFADATFGNTQLETLFDEHNDEYGVPRGAFAAFKLRAIHVATSTQLFTGDNYGAFSLPLLKRQAGADDASVKWAIDEMKADSKIARASLLKHGIKLYLGNGKDIVLDNSASAIFPAQKTFAEWMGDTRVARIGKPLVTADDIATRAIPKLLPGDVLVARQNWFLSNIGLPGFWPHALLYTGTAADLKTAFDADPEVLAWAKKEGAATFTALLAKRFPEKWKVYSEGKDFQGHGPIRVIESISEGVSFTATEHAFGVDYLAAMRPRLSPLDKAKAIERAFKYQGRPYDFDFDFFSDASLVCTELVYKSYQPAADFKGISVELVDVAGRRTLPANEIVKRFDTDARTDARQLDFVFFLDGREKEGKVVDGDEKAFRSSWQRVKWDVAQD